VIDAGDSPDLVLSYGITPRDLEDAMQTHDDRRIPLDPQPESRSLLESIRGWLSIGQARRNKREAAQAKAAAENAPLREAEARRKATQPGVSPELAEKFAKVVARVGGGK
jgi:hypothetical protein